MSNMSYCRFRNTYEDLKDCLNHFHDTDLSDEEARARFQMLNRIWQFLSGTSEDDLDMWNPDSPDYSYGNNEEEDY